MDNLAFEILKTHLDDLGFTWNDPSFFIGYKDSPVSLGVKTPTFYTCAGTQQLHSIIHPWPRKNEPGFDLCHGASVFHATEAMVVSLLQLGRALALRPITLCCRLCSPWPLWGKVLRMPCCNVAP